jgi:hypothetical protein
LLTTALEYHYLLFLFFHILDVHHLAHIFKYLHIYWHVTIIAFSLSYISHKTHISMYLHYTYCLQYLPHVFYPFNFPFFPPSDPPHSSQQMCKRSSKASIRTAQVRRTVQHSTVGLNLLFVVDCYLLLLLSIILFIF